MKKSWIKKGIVILIMLAIFLAPVSAGIKINNEDHLAVEVEVNKAKATDLCEIHLGLPSIEGKASDGIKISVQISVDTGRNAMDEDGDGIIDGKNALSIITGIGCKNSSLSEDGEMNAWNAVTTVVKKNADGKFLLPDDIFFVDVGESYDSSVVLTNPIKDIVKSVSIHPDITLQSQIMHITIPLPKSTTPKTYYVSARLEESGFLPIFTVRPHPNTPSDKFPLSVSLPTDNSQINPTGEATETSTDQVLGKAYFQCNITSGDGFVGCIAFAIYYIIWEPSAAVANFAGKILDFFVYYSTNSDSYSAEFVTKAWGAVRDIANILFIIALLYVAIKTILGLNVTNNKKLIGVVIIVALIINFSLFTTKVVIDGSNILAKIFYNNITSVDKNQKTLETGTEGEKPISAGLSRQFNPQEIITNYNVNKGQFIFVTLLSAALMLFMAYIFFSVALLFVTRVVSLWISMIFSPLAFASYTVPFEIPGFGHKKWWDDLLKNAFLAPIFIFFLYVIILFGDFFSLITYDTKGADFTQTAMKTIIPFAIIFMLLVKAKKLAVEYSGEMGAAITKYGAMAGGLALGAATGGTALAGSKFIGGHYQKIANDDELRKKAAEGDRGAQRKLARANYMASKSFDFRQTGVGKGFGKISGMDMSKGLGIKATSAEQLKGGAKARDERKYEKAEERRKSYEMTPSAAREQNEKAGRAKTQNERAEQYDKDRREAQKNIGPLVIGSDSEKYFREAYEKGGDMSEFGLDKKVKAGSVKEVKEVKTAEEINLNRRRAYAYSLEHPIESDMRTKDRSAMRSFLMEWKRGMTGMLGTKGGLATTATAIVLGGPIGTAVALSLGGLVKAIKATRPANKDLVARIAREKSSLEKLTDVIGKAGVKDKYQAEKIAKDLEKQEKKEPEK